MTRLSLAALLALAVAVLASSSGSGDGRAATTPCSTHTAAFGWEANRLHNSGANLVLPVTQPLRLTRITVDYSMTRTPGTKAGWREVLAYAALDPSGTTGAPSYQPVTPGAPGWGASTRSGAASHGGGMSDRIFAQAILKNLYSGQLVREPLDYQVTAGDKVWVHVDAVGTPVDVEAQGSLEYSTC